MFHATKAFLEQETCPLRLSVPFAVGEARQSNNSIGP